jgi:TonB family protein
MRYLAALLLFRLIVSLPCAKAQKSPLDAEAADAAAAIAKASRKHEPAPKVLVADFVETRGHKTALGADLARQFFLSLQTHARNFTFADRDEYLHKFAADMVAPQSYDDLDTMRCVASDLAADFVVTGELDDLPDTVAVWIRVSRVEDRKLIFDKRVSLPLTPAMEQLLRQAPEALASSNSNGSAAGLPDRDRAPAGGANGYSQPACIYCPNPQFSDAAVKQKLQGTVVMNVRIGLDGRAHDLAIVRGLPCGLNGQAIDAVRRWNFRPANGPDGQPAEVTTVVEITFRLY